MTGTERAESKELAGDLVRNAKEQGRDLAETVFTEPIEGNDLELLLKRLMWNEFAPGVHSPAKQIELLLQSQGGDVRGHQHMDIVIGLAEQIRDEIKHSKLFSRRLEELGANPNILEIEVTDAQVELFDQSYQREDIVSIAGALQITSEPVLTSLFDTILREELADERTLELIRLTQIDEGNHINVGKQIVTRFATDEADRQRVVDAHEEMLSAIFGMYGLSSEPTGPVA